MASPVAALSNLAVKLGDLALQEANYLDGVGEKLTCLRTELIWMKCFLKDAAAERGSRKEVVAAWVAEVRELAYEAEDIIDTFDIKAPSKRRGSILKEDWWLHKMGKKIDELTEKISALTRRAQTYGIQPAANDGESSVRRLPRLETFPNEIEKDVVGFDGYMKTLVSALLQEKERQRCGVVVIAGMGGLGKTTLAKKVYHHSGIRRHFEKFTWVCVSQQYRDKDVWQRIMLDLESPEEEGRREILKLTAQKLQERLHQKLQQKKCLVVLDDMWRNEDWNFLKAAFPMDQQSNLSKILITTRHDTVAEDPNRFLLKPACLNEDQSWELLRKIVFPSSIRTGAAGRTVDVEDSKKGLAREMVKHCGGLPLAIRVLGGLLTASSTEWSTIQTNIKSQIARGGNQGQENTGVRNILTTSYEDLPAHLKSCFIYMAQFPEDFEISMDKLEKMWIAEGMIEPVEVHWEEGQDELEDLAKSYLSQLIQRNMVLAGKRGLNNELETCRLHDLMRDLCLSKAKEENMLQILNRSVVDNKSGVHSLSKIGNVRRLAIHKLNLLYPNPHLRSLWFFCDIFRRIEEETIDGIFSLSPLPWNIFWLSRQFLVFVTNNYKLLRILDLEFISLRALPSKIGELKYLKMLTFGVLYIRKLPSSLGKLRCLQTLNLALALTWRVHNMIWELEELRHLHLPVARQRRGRKFKIGRWKNLRTLKNFPLHNGDLEGLGELTQLRELDVIIEAKDLTQRLVEAFSSALCNLRHLQSLSISSYERSETILDVTPILKALLGCPHFHKLELHRFRIKFPEDHRMIPPTVTHLALGNVIFSEDPMLKLEKLPNLRFLRLCNVYWEGDSILNCTHKAFPILFRLNFITRVLKRLLLLKERCADLNAWN